MDDRWDLKVISYYCVSVYCEWGSVVARLGEAPCVATGGEDYDGAAAYVAAP